MAPKKPGAGAKPKAPELTPQDEATKAAGVRYCDEIAATPGWHGLPGGIVFRILKLGNQTPIQRSPEENEACVVHYRGALIDGTKFDASHDRGEPATFRPNQVIKGWGEALRYMGEGDKWEVVIPWHMAYGKEAVPGKVRIPPYSALRFEIELVMVKGVTEHAKPGKAAAAVEPAPPRLASTARDELAALLEKPFASLLWVEPPPATEDGTHDGDVPPAA